MYCNLSHYIVSRLCVATQIPRRDATKRVSGNAECRATARFPLASPTRRRQSMLINWAGLYLERLERFSCERALISTISKINISLIIANIAWESVWNFYVYLDPIYLPISSGRSLAVHLIYIYI